MAQTDGLNISTGIGEGEAQVMPKFDFSYMDRQEAARQRDAAAQRATGQKNVSDLSKSLQSLNKLDIFFRDQPVFAQKNKELWDYANKNIRAIREGDTATKLNVDKMVSDLENEAQLSKADKESYVHASLALATSGKQSNLRPESNEYMTQFASPERAGQYGFDPSKIRFNEDIGEWVNKELVPIAKDKAKKGKTVTKPDENGIVYSTDINEYTPSEAKELFTKGLESNPIMRDQANYNFSKLPQQEQDAYKDPINYEFSKYQDRLVKKANEYDVKGVGGKGDFGIQIGDGMATTDKFRFTGETTEEKNPAYSVTKASFSPGYDVPKTRKVEIIKVKSIKGGENPTYNIIDPTREGKTFPGIIDHFKKKPDGATDFIFVNKNNGKYVTVPEKKVTAEVKNDIGYDPEVIFQTGITKGKGKSIEKGGERAVVNSQAEYDALPKGAKYTDSKGNLGVKR